jgi:hypothetical protein
MESFKEWTISGREFNRLFTNAGNRFVYSHFTTGTGYNYDARSVAAADLNRDGAPDLVINNRQGQPFQMLYNRLPAGANALLLKFENRMPNHAGIGTVVTVTCGGHTQLKQLTAGDAFLTQAPPELHFGLADCIDSPLVRVKWPDGLKESVTVAPNTLTTIKRGAGVRASVPLKARPER